MYGSIDQSRCHNNLPWHNGAQRRLYRMHPLSNYPLARGTLPLRLVSWASETFLRNPHLIHSACPGLQTLQQPCRGALPTMCPDLLLDRWPYGLAARSQHTPHP